MDYSPEIMNFVPSKLLPWDNMNENEGVVEGQLEGIGNIVSYTILTGGTNEWQELEANIGKTVQVGVIFKRMHRNKLPKVLPAEATPGLVFNKAYGYERADGYELICRVSAVEKAEEREDGNNILTIDQPFTLQIDLDYPVNVHPSQAPVIKPGDMVHIIGIFELDFDPE